MRSAGALGDYWWEASIITEMLLFFFRPATLCFSMGCIIFRVKKKKARHTVNWLMEEEEEGRLLSSSSHHHLIILATAAIYI
mmetsp:Transcript_4414/g.7955  ORF Transcript_4414/g.7955 Transcript_4414/m.7955 type:complete len:82 (+) Transcript_4414:872-1117(+)